MPYYGMMDYYYGPGYAWMIIFCIVAIALIVWLVIGLLNRRVPRRTHRDENDASDMNDEDDALQILRRRYARGDISRREFEQMQDDLTK